MAELDKRLEGVLVGTERLPEFRDALIKRTFGAFLNEFKAPQYRKAMEKDRRVEDLLLIFFSNATKELQKGKPPDDDSWKLMVDRHVALFVRLLSDTLRKHGWAQDRPELSSRLQKMEKKLLVHDQDLAAETQRNGGAGGTTVQVEVPRSYEVRDMPLVQVVQRIWGYPYAHVQSDVAAYKDVWTEKAALQDLKAYQANLELNTTKTLGPEDFDTEDAYEAWKRAETPDLSQMMLAIIQSNPELAKTTSANGLPQFNPSNGSFSDSETSRRMSEQSENPSSYVIEQPLDMSGLTLTDSANGNHIETPFTFIPPDPRSYYRAVLREALTHDLQDSELQPTEATADRPSIKLLSRQSAELLNEIALRWRIPYSTRMVLFLDVIKEKYQQQDISLDTVDAAFEYIKTPPPVDKKANRMSMVVQESITDWRRWTISDYATYQRALSGLHDALLRDLYELLLLCYDAKGPPLGPVMYILTTHIYDDPLFSKTPEDLDQFSAQLRDALRQRAAEVYHDLLAKQLPDDKEQWEFFHVIELGKAVAKLCEKIQKRFRKTPEIMG